MKKFTPFYEIDKGDLFYISTKNGGYNACIRPQDYAGGKPWFDGSVLANCVGCANGTFNKLYSLMTGYKGSKYPYLNCNAEDFVTRAKQYYPDIQIVNHPVAGGIMVMNGAGKLAGHVFTVMEVLENKSIKTLESDYGGTVQYSKIRTNDNGRWGMSNSYSFLNCLVSPYISFANDDKKETRDQIKVNSPVIRIRREPTLKGDILGFALEGYYDVLGTSKADGYTWYQLDTHYWIAGVNEIEFIPKAEDEKDILIRDLKLKLDEVNKLAKQIEKECKHE